MNVKTETTTISNDNDLYDFCPEVPVTELYGHELVRIVTEGKLVFVGKDGEV